MAKKIIKVSSKVAPKKVAVKEVSATKKPKETKTVRGSALSVPVYNLDGKSTREMNLPKELFNVEASPKLIAQYVRVYLANQRQGTATAKTRAEVIGTTKKTYRQKGTGRARHGSKKASLFVGGGVTFGPQVRDYTLSMNKKQKRKALLYSLTLKAQEKGIIGLNNDMLKIQPKTKAVVKIFQTIGTHGKKTLLVLPESQGNNLARASRNIPTVDIVTAVNINPYDLLTHEHIMFVEDAVKALQTRILKS